MKKLIVILIIVTFSTIALADDATFEMSYQGEVYNVDNTTVGSAELRVEINGTDGVQVYNEDFGAIVGILNSGRSGFDAVVGNTTAFVPVYNQPYYWSTFINGSLMGDPQYFRAPVGLITTNTILDGAITEADLNLSSVDYQRSIANLTCGAGDFFSAYSDGTLTCSTPSGESDTNETIRVQAILDNYIPDNITYHQTNYKHYNTSLEIFSAVNNNTWQWVLANNTCSAGDFFSGVTSGVFSCTTPAGDSDTNETVRVQAILDSHIPNNRTASEAHINVSYVDITDSFSGEVTGPYSATVIDNDALDDQYYELTDKVFNTSDEIFSAVNNGSWNAPIPAQTCNGTDIFTSFTSPYFTCSAPTVGGAGAGDKWVDDGSIISPNTTFATQVNASLYTTNWETNVSGVGIETIGYIRAQDYSHLNITESQIFDLAHATDTIWGLATDGYLYNNSDLLTFNSSMLSSRYYAPYQAAAIAGTVTGGDVSLVNHTDAAYDSIAFNFTEVATSPGVDLRMNFSGIETFNEGVIRYRTRGAYTGDFPLIQVWDYDGSAWESYGYLPETGDEWSIIQRPVFDSADHVSGSIVQMRIYKASNGNINNDFEIDWVSIIRGFGTPAGEEVDPLSVHRDGSTTLTNNWDAGDYHINATGFTAALYNLSGQYITSWADVNGSGDGVGTNCNGTDCTLYTSSFISIDDRNISSWDDVNFTYTAGDNISITGNVIASTVSTFSSLWTDLTSVPSNLSGTNCNGTSCVLYATNITGNFSQISLGNYTIERWSEINLSGAADGIGTNCNGTSCSLSAGNISGNFTFLSLAEDTITDWDDLNASYTSGDNITVTGLSIALSATLYENWVCDSDSGSATIGSGETLMIAGGTNLSTAIVGNTLTISHTISTFSGDYTDLSNTPTIPSNETTRVQSILDNYIPDNRTASEAFINASYVSLAMDETVSGGLNLTGPLNASNDGHAVTFTGNCTLIVGPTSTWEIC